MLLRVSGGKMVKSKQAFCGSRAASNVAIKLWLDEGGGTGRVGRVGGTVAVMGPSEEICWRALKSIKVRPRFVMVDVQLEGIRGEVRVGVVSGGKHRCSHFYVTTE